MSFPPSGSGSYEQAEGSSDLPQLSAARGYVAGKPQDTVEMFGGDGIVNKEAEPKMSWGSSMESEYLCMSGMILSHVLVKKEARHLQENK